MSKIFRAPRAGYDNSAADAPGDDCKNGCPLQPHFKDAAGAVELTRDKYVQLLIEARETDPGCWPPGLESAAHLLERACAIEEACALKHGHFEPERLSKKLGDEYLHIHLTLDELQNSVETEADSNADDADESDGDESDDKVPLFVTMPHGTWAETNTHLRPDNFA